jgi:hypothetical protein
MYIYPVALSIFAIIMMTFLLSLIFNEEVVRLGFCSFLWKLIFIGVGFLLLLAIVLIIFCKIIGLIFAFLVISPF